MKLSTPSQLSNVEGKDFERYVAIAISDIVAAINGNIGIPDNVAAQIVTIAFNTANKQVGVANPLGRTPNGVIPIKLSAAMIIYSGESANSATTLNLKSSAVGTAQVLVF